jgi:16S rRNA (uracil1498-N3)-methyltransferase
MSRRAPIAALGPGERRLEGPVAHYLGRVLRLQAGDEFLAFDPDAGTEADAVAIEVDAGAVVVRIGSTRRGLAGPTLGALTWIQGLAKGDKCDQVVRDATELGAARVVVATTQRTVVRLDPHRSETRRARWTRIAREAARQCGRSDVPTIDGPLPWPDALARVDVTSARFCLWERATEPLAQLLFEALDRPRAVAFACGPEGGLDDAEAALAFSSGWHLVRIGPFALRTETVAAAVLGAARVWAGMFAPRS